MCLGQGLSSLILLQACHLYFALFFRISSLLSSSLVSSFIYLPWRRGRWIAAVHLPRQHLVVIVHVEVHSKLRSTSSWVLMTKSVCDKVARTCWYLMPSLYYRHAFFCKYELDASSNSVASKSSLLAWSPDPIKSDNANDTCWKMKPALLSGAGER